MKTIYHLVRNAALAASLAAFPAFASAPELPVHAVVEASSPVSVEWVHAHLARDGINVSGFVKRVPKQFGTVQGGLEVSARLADGRIVATQLVRWNAMPRKGGRGAAFALRMPVQGNVAAIEVRYVSAVASAS